MSKSVALSILILAALIISREMEPVNMPAVAHAKVISVTPPENPTIAVFGAGSTAGTISVQGSVPVCADRNGSCWTNTTNKVVYPVAMQTIPPQSAPARP